VYYGFSVGYHKKKQKKNNLHYFYSTINNIYF